jgi:hypothetical protein
MTEAEWLTTLEAHEMLNLVGGRLSARKSRLLAAACCETYRRYFRADGCLAAIETACQTADEAGANSEREAAFAQVQEQADLEGPYDGYNIAAIAAFACGNTDQVMRVPFLVLEGMDCDLFLNPRKGISCWLRCLLGNPFRPVVFDPRWRTADAVGLARGIYEERAFDRLPLLADALMDAGCADEQVLSHCRSEGPHVRGCWVVDLVLGKE